MDVRLKVLNGGQAGKELPIKGPKFFVGRSEECHLRPKSDLISRHHCVLMFDDAVVAVRDLGSRNGTLINDEPVVGERELTTGDRLKIGQLEFEIIIKIGEKPPKRPKVKSIKEAVARTAETVALNDLDIDVSDFLEEDEPTQPDRAVTDTLVGEVAVDTEEISLSDTHPGTSPEVEPKPSQAESKPHRKAPPPPRQMPGASSDDSGSAAAEALRKFLNRR